MKTKYSTICDLYSLGLIFHILLTGKSAFPGTTYNEVLSQNRAAIIELTGDDYKKVNPQALDLLEHLLKKKPT
jgi:calcium-dependent protein kinase